MFSCMLLGMPGLPIAKTSNKTLATADIQRNYLALNVFQCVHAASTGNTGTATATAAAAATSARNAATAATRGKCPYSTHDAIAMIQCTLHTYFQLLLL